MKKTSLFFTSLSAYLLSITFTLQALLAPRLASDEVGDPQELVDNTLIVCDNGLEMFHWDLDFLRHAEQSVEILACFFGGDIARELLGEIEARLQEVPELQVYLLASPVLIQEEDWEIIHRLRRNHPHNFHMELATQIIKMLPDVTSIDNHVKMFIVDEKYYSMGGTNLEEVHCSDGSVLPEKNHDPSYSFLPAAMRDQDVVGRGPLAKELRKIFHQLYALWEYYNHHQLLEMDPGVFAQTSHYSPISPSPTQIVRFEEAAHKRTLAVSQTKLLLGGPHQSRNAITEEYVRLINGAEKEIMIANLYFFPTRAIFNALLDAVNRGVRLTLLTNGLSEVTPQGTQLFCWANRISYLPIFQGNSYHLWDAERVAAQPPKKTRVFEYHLPNIMLHKKVMLVDDEFFVVGSYNLGFKSAYGDYELVLVVHSKEVAHDVHQVLNKDLSHAREILPEEAHRWYFDPFISYLGALQRKFHGFF